VVTLPHVELLPWFVGIFNGVLGVTLRVIKYDVYRRVTRVVDARVITLAVGAEGVDGGRLAIVVLTEGVLPHEDPREEHTVDVVLTVL